MSIPISREELYAQVWKRPMVKVAADYGISDVALKKICVKHRIPVPGRGYWAKKAAGKKVTQTILRKLDDPAINKIIITGGPGARLAPEVIETKKRVHERERRAVNKVEVAKTSNNLHPAVERTKKKLERSRPGERRMVSATGPSFFNVLIGPENVSRVAQFLNTFVLAAESRGYQLKKADQALQFVVNGEVLAFRIVERTDRVRHEPTEKEKATLEKWERQQHRQGLDWRLDNWFSRPTIPEWDSIPNGKLAVLIDDQHYDGLRRTFADGKKQKIETLINAILVGLETCAAAKKANKEEIERRHRRWKEEECRREELRQRNALEKKRIEALMKDIESWRQGRQILEFIGVVEKKLNANDYDDREAVQEWVDWAKDYAEQIDPMKIGLPRLLHFKDFSSWELS